jgi:hypothetical protein
MAGREQAEVFFHEVQRFRQWWIWLIVLAIAALQWWAAYEQLLMGRPFGDNPAPDALLFVFFLLFGIGMPWLFLSAKLVTVVAADAIYVRFVPFHFRMIRIPFEDVVGFSAGQYSPLRDYGGWGIRFGREGKAYNASGNLGVRLEFARGNKLLIGSQHPLEFVEAIKRAKEAHTGRR